MFSVRRTPVVLSLLTSALALSSTLAAQTTTSHTAATTAAHRRVAPATPALPKNIPPVKGPVKVEFALRYQEIQLGTGDEAKPGEMYSVNYTGWLASDGTKFDSSYDRGRPIEFPQGMRRVIIGWDQGFLGMKVGGKRRLFIPYQLAYGDAGRGPIPAKADLIFDVELVAVKDLSNVPEPRVPRVMPPGGAPGQPAPQGTPQSAPQGGTPQNIPQSSPAAAPQTSSPSSTPSTPPASTPQSAPAPAKPQT